MGKLSDCSLHSYLLLVLLPTYAQNDDEVLLLSLQECGWQ